MVWLEALSYVVTILGFPGAIAVFTYEHRRRSANEENEIHRNLSEEYDNFLRLVLDNADLLLLRRVYSDFIAICETVCNGSRNDNRASFSRVSNGKWTI